MANGQYLSVDCRSRLVVGDKNLPQRVTGKFKLLKNGDDGGSVCLMSSHLNKCPILSNDKITLLFNADNANTKLEMSQPQIVAITSLSFKLRSLQPYTATPYFTNDHGIICQRANSFADAVTFTLEPVGPENSF